MDLEKHITANMESYFVNRTNRHIELVKRNAYTILNRLPVNNKVKNTLLANVQKHDASKFTDPERLPYIILSWKYHVEEDEFSKMKIPPEILATLNTISEHHLKHNQHHPEYWDINLTNNFEGKVVRAEAMLPVHIIEMVCDWTAVAQEGFGKSAREWAYDNVNVRWKFTPEQTNLIYSIIDILEGNNEDKQTSGTSVLRQRTNHFS